MSHHDRPSFINVTECLKHWDTKNFEDEFFAELSENEHELPLQGMCVNAGYPSVEDCVVFDDLKIDKEIDGEIEGSFQVAFKEEMNTSCGEVKLPEKISGRIKFSMDLTTGDVEFVSTYLEKRQYERDEF